MKNKKLPIEWNLDILFKNTPANIKKERAKIKRAYSKFVKKWSNRKDYLKKSSVLKRALDEYEKLIKNNTSNEYLYLSLSQQKDSNNPKIKAQLNKAHQHYDPVFNSIEFFGLNISKIPHKEQKKFLKSKLLKEYKHFLETLFNNAKYLLSEPEEKLLNLKAGVSHGNWQEMLSRFLAKDAEEVFIDKTRKAKKGYAEIIGLYQNGNKKVRESAYKAINTINDRYSDVAEAEMNSILENKRINDDLRGIERPEKSRHISDDMETEVVDKIIERISKHFRVSKEYYKLRAKLIGKKKIIYQERTAPIKGRIQKKTSYKESVKIVAETLSELDKEFNDIFMGFVKNGQLDVYPKQGKRNGGFCTVSSKKQPTYIFLNHDGYARSVMTIAHEVGHGINHELIRDHENALNSGNSLAIAEIASTFMEDFVWRKMVTKVSDEEKFYLMANNLDDQFITIHRQIAAYKFEQELHNEFRKKGYLPKNDINEMFAKHMKAYIGPVLKRDQSLDTGWIGWDHFRWFFYVYSYASGLLISKYLQARVRENPEFIEEVKKFLSVGSSESPKESLKKLGIDITKASFWDKGLKEIENNFKEFKKLAKKLGKIK